MELHAKVEAKSHMVIHMSGTGGSNTCISYFVPLNIRDPRARRPER